MSELIKLGEKYRAMKLIYTKHDAQRASRYACEHLYPTYLERFRDKKFNLLEIGIGYGGSLRMWKEYFPKANIFGIDIDPKTAFSEDRIETFIGDQEDVGFLSYVMSKIGEVSIVIDDAGHTPAAQSTSLWELFPKMSPGGLYVIEDLHLSYDRDRRGGGENNPSSIMENLKGASDGVVRGDNGMEFIHFYKNIAFMGKKNEEEE